MVGEVDVPIMSSYDEAVEFLGIKDLYVNGDIKTVETIPSHSKALEALSKLFIIAEAWNKQDGFVLDFSDIEQQKHFPWFDYFENVGKFVCTDTDWSLTKTVFNIGGSRLCFATRERALAFGNIFEDLYNEFLLN